MNMAILSFKLCGKMGFTQSHFFLILIPKLIVIIYPFNPESIWLGEPNMCHLGYNVWQKLLTNTKDAKKKQAQQERNHSVKGPHKLPQFQSSLHGKGKSDDGKQSPRIHPGLGFCTENRQEDWQLSAPPWFDFPWPFHFRLLSCPTRGGTLTSRFSPPAPAEPKVKR